jgi:predicted O-linked N-acetylglucosamine transferase (SPINDLY family)
MEPLSYFLAYGRLAPVQCVMAGHPVTTGIGNVDYFLSSEQWESAEADAHYSEKLIRLPSPPIYFARPALPPVLKTRSELGLPETQHIYMCPMRLQKLHPDFDEAIARILQLDSNSVVVLFEDDTWPYWKEMLLKRFEQTVPAGLRERIMFLPWLKNQADFLSAIAAADVLLDPFHFGIGSTAVTSCVTGTPLVTKTGEFMRGRVGTGYCRMLGVPECITEDMESYARLAVEIANDHALRESIKARILKNNSVLYENPQPVEDFVECILRLANGGAVD